MSSIIRVAKSRDNPYAVINKAYMSRADLTLKAKGLLGLLLSKPDNWTVTVTGLLPELCESKDAVRTALAELQKAGYLERRQFKGSGGRWYCESIVYETPKSGVSSEILRGGLSVTDAPSRTTRIVVYNESVSNELFTGPAAPPVEAKKPKPSPPSPTRSLTDYFCARWRECFGVAYSFKSGRDGKAAAELLKYVGGDADRAKALVNAFFADRDPFLVKLGHRLSDLGNQPEKWARAARQWSGFKPELPEHKAQRDERLVAQRGEQERHRREAEDDERRIATDLSGLSPADLEGLRVEFLATLVDERFRAKLASADWRANAVLRGGIHATLKARRLRNAGVVL